MTDVRTTDVRATDVRATDARAGAVTTRTFALPDVGEGLTEAEVVRWLVAEGEVVVVNAPIVEIETAKSLVELPSPWAGRVEALLVPEGRTVDVGTALIAVGVEAGATAEGVDEVRTGVGARPSVVDVRDGVATGGAAVPAPGATSGAAPAAAPAAAEGASAPTSVLVGYGVKEGPAPRRRRPRRVPAPAVHPRADDDGAGLTTAEPAAGPTGGPAGLPAEDSPVTGARPLTKPPVRLLARALGVDLGGVSGSGAGGIITRDDVLAARGHPAPGPAASAPPAPDPASPDLAGPDPASPAPASPASAGPAPASPVPVGARETRVPVRGVRRATATQMVASAFTAPHASAFLTVDATRTVKLLDRLREDRAFAEVHVSPLLVIARAVCLAVARHPEVNATWDEAAGEIVVKHYVNLGVAVATPRGLLVPNVKDAQAMDLHGLAQGLTALVKTARAGRSTPADLGQGTISITNVGVFGVDTGTPILNPGESVILCVGAVRKRPWVHKGKVKPRWVVQLSVSLDHRVIDGDLGSRFLADVGALLERPDRALLWS